ncbi:hypothetical protein Psal006b_00879 [Piscirickettsia salmonis]|uniref:Transposase n=2 Tax=Piscirickettsia salmonis TaxID=1238 RepID=A0AAC8VJ89_PISSA|nr:transposase [Piscirickettsia salmonis]QGN97906.1 hypothetical protein Psal006b_00879 [Piscirickettsia salmonis]QGO01511.1 hypothetical protein Psal008_00885 [Piscirickettsia salmonis]QGO12222.1 hypothetical protein Psal010b_00880 [Piscirickettsia salmonis]QGO19244.1 hypothetical protein Psal013_00877 [Piscirickettsia salmonis]
MECAASRHVTLCDADSRGFIVVAFCSAILHHWMCKIPTEVATLTNCRSFRSRFYTPFVTLILFIRQVLSPDKSCKNTVATFLASVSTEDNNNIPSSNTGPYCNYQ